MLPRARQFGLQRLSVRSNSSSRRVEPRDSNRTLPSFLPNERSRSLVSLHPLASLLFHLFGRIFLRVRRLFAASSRLLPSFTASQSRINAKSTLLGSLDRDWIGSIRSGSFRKKQISDRRSSKWRSRRFRSRRSRIRRVIWFDFIWFMSIKRWGN